MPERTRALVLADSHSGADTAEGRRSRAELAERVMRESRLAIIPRAGHLANRENPDVFNWTLKELLGELG